MARQDRVLIGCLVSPDTVKHILHKALKAIAVGAAVIFPLVANLNTPIVSALSGSILFLGQPNITLATTVQTILPPKTVIVVGTSTPISNDQQILNEAQSLVDLYGTRPYWTETPFDPRQDVPASQVDDVLAHLITCENPARLEDPTADAKVLDSNNKYSYGILQIQAATWAKWSAVSGVTGTPILTSDAIKQATWAVENGDLSAWSCASILKIIKK